MQNREESSMVIKRKHQLLAIFLGWKILDANVNEFYYNSDTFGQVL